MDRTLLIVDDEPDLCDFLDELTAPLANLRLIARDGEEALHIMRSTASPVDAIISDISMPKKDGTELLRELRFLGFQTPFIFLTGFGDREKMATALRHGAFDFFDKPTNTKLLLPRLQQALDFGFSLRTLDQEVESLLKSAGADGGDTSKFREALSAVLFVRKKREAFFKKAS